jgi:predicted dehydrogenase
MIKLATIGTSWITADFVKAAQTVEGIEYVGAYSRDIIKARVFAAKFGGKLCFDNLDEFACSEDFDSVYIASPNVFHYEQSKLLLSAGKNVICEKPITVTPEQLSELQKLAKEKDLVYMEAIMFLHLPELQILKDAMKTIGNITSAHFDFSQLSSKYKLLTPDFVPNIFNPRMAAGCLMDIGIYNVYTALELFGVPETIKADSYFMSTGADSHGVAVFNYPDKQVTLNYSKVAQSYGYSQIFGDNGTILIPSISQLNNMKVIYTDGTEKILTEDLKRTYIMSCEAKAFRNYIEKKDNYPEYNYVSDIALKTSKAMFEIRNQNPEFLF